MALPQVYTPTEAAEVMKVSRRTVYQWIRDGLLTAVRPGPRLLVIHASEIERFLSGRSAPVVQSKRASARPLEETPASSAGPSPSPAKPAKKRRR